MKGRSLSLLLLAAVLLIMATIMLGQLDHGKNGVGINKTNNDSIDNNLEHNIIFYGEGEIKITFKVAVPSCTPREDAIYLRIQGYRHGGGSGGIPMDRIDNLTWSVGYNTGPDVELRYKYNRNNYGYPTDEEFTPDDDGTWRSLSVGTEPEVVSEAVGKWRWLSNEPIQAKISNYVPFESREEPFVMGVFPLDFYDQAFTDYVPSTLDRIRAMGIDYVGIAYVPSFFTGSDPLTFAREPINTYSLGELELAIELAGERGLKVLLAPGIETDPGSFEEIEEGFSRPHSDDWYLELFREWNETMVETAIFAEEHGVDILTPSNQWPFWGVRTPEQDVMLNDLVNEAFRSIRSVFSGAISSDFYSESEAFDYYRQMDWIGDKWWWALADGRATDLDEMIARAELIIDQIYEPVHKRYGKPIFLQQVAYPSYDGGAGGLQINIEGPEVAEWFPYNPLYPEDFQEQADAYEAVFRALYDEAIFAGAFSFGYSYWDSQDKSPGIRSKPAEKVWGRWAKIFMSNRGPG